MEIALGDGSSRDDETRARKRSKAPAAPRRPLTFPESATSLHHQLHFRDKRPPHLLQSALERELMVLFTAAMEGERLPLRACANVNGAHYEFVLRFVAALPRDNCYLLCPDVSWADQPPTCHDHFRNTANRWLELWTRDLMPATPPSVREGLRERYRQYCEATLQAERHLDSAAAVQRAIVAGMKHGGSFGTSHKEGGTSIYWRDGKFIRSDYGDNPDLKEFSGILLPDIAPSNAVPRGGFAGDEEAVQHFRGLTSPGHWLVRLLELPGGLPGHAHGAVPGRGEVKPAGDAVGDSPLAEGQSASAAKPPWGAVAATCSARASARTPTRSVDTLVAKRFDATVKAFVRAIAAHLKASGGDADSALKNTKFARDFETEVRA